MDAAVLGVAIRSVCLFDSSCHFVDPLLGGDVSLSLTTSILPLVLGENQWVRTGCGCNVRPPRVSENPSQTWPEGVRMGSSGLTVRLEIPSVGQGSGGCCGILFVPEVEQRPSPDKGFQLALARLSRAAAS